MALIAIGVALAFYGGYSVCADYSSTCVAPHLVYVPVLFSGALGMVIFIVDAWTWPKREIRIRARLTDES